MTQTRPLIPHNLSLLEIAAIVAVIVIWGVNNAAAKVATDSLPPHSWRTTTSPTRSTATKRPSRRWPR